MPAIASSPSRSAPATAASARPFAPLMRRLADLGVGKKLLLIYLLDLCTVIFVSSILIQEKYLAIDASRKELAGAAYIDALRPLLVALARVDAPYPDAAAGVRAVDRVEAGRGEGLGSYDASVHLGRAMRALVVDNDTVHERQLRQQAAFERGRELWTRVGNQSNLIRDPDPDAYYTVSLVLLRYPQLLDVVAQLTPALQAAAAGRPLAADDRARLYVLEGELRSVAQSIASDYLEATEASPQTLREHLTPSNRTLEHAIVRFEQAVRDAASGSRADPLEDLAQRGRLIDAIDGAWAAGLHESQRLIRARIDNHFAKMALHLGTALALLGLILVAVYFVAQRISRPLGLLSSVVDTVRRTGDHTLRSRWSSRDEIGLLVLGFNDMLAQLDEQRKAQQELAASARAAEAQQRIVELLPVPLMVTSIPDHRVLHANPRAREWLGDCDLDPWAASITPGQRRRFFQQLADAEVVDEFEVRWQRGAQSAWAVLSARRLDFQGQDAVVTAFTPINGRKALEQRLELWAKVFEASSEGIVLFDANGEVLSANRAFCKASGSDPAELMHAPLGIVAVGQTPLAGATEAWGGAERRGWWRGEVQVQRRDSGAFPAWAVLTAVRDATGSISHYIFSCVDITDRKASEEQVRYLADHDLLTGLPNRGVVERRMEDAMARSSRSGQPLAVLFIDLDRFKTINDSLGHQAGDEVLKAVAQRLRNAIREIDTVGRFGGDEFVVLLDGVSGSSEAMQIAQRLKDALHAPYAVEALELDVSCSIGIAMFPDDAADLDELMRHADAAMYQAKAAGRDGVYFFTRDLNDQAQRKLQTERMLRNALARGEMHLVYQPQVNAHDGALLAVEALLRWTTPELGEISPAVFIPLAEESRLILPIGEWVIDEAVRQLADWQRRGLDTGVMSINLSGVQLHDAGLIPTLRATLARHGVAAGRVEFELTESTLMAHTDDRLRHLHALKELGVHLSIDDFGTGYSSLAYLSRLPMGKLKIDRSLVKNILTEPKDRAISEAVIALAHRLKMTVVAEGVDAAAVQQALAEARCDAIQGFHAGQPMAPAVFEGWLAERATLPEWPPPPVGSE